MGDNATSVANLWLSVSHAHGNPPSRLKSSSSLPRCHTPKGWVGRKETTRGTPRRVHLLVPARPTNVSCTPKRRVQLPKKMGASEIRESEVEIRCRTVAGASCFGCFGCFGCCWCVTKVSTHAVCA